MRIKSNLIALTTALTFVAAPDAFTANKACNDDSFQNFYEKVQRDSNPKYVRLNKTADNYGGFNPSCYSLGFECADFYGT